MFLYFLNFGFGGNDEFSAVDGRIAERHLFSARIVPASAMRVHLHIAERSLPYAKIYIFIYLKHPNHEKGC